MLKSVASVDYPDRWPSLMPAITVAITSNDEAKTEGGLIALLCVLKKYEHKQAKEGERPPADAIVSATFPVLVQLFPHLSSVPGDTSANMQRVLCKIL